MTPQRVKEIYEEVIEEKDKISVIDISEDKEDLHNGIDPRVAKFLEQYEKDPKSCSREFEELDKKAQQLLEKVKLG